MARRGFTTVRDACGGDRGLVPRDERRADHGPAAVRVRTRAVADRGARRAARQRRLVRGAIGFASRIADGVDEVRRAAREELRAGADHIKIMASGGVASPSDEIWTLQYSPAEMRRPSRRRRAALLRARARLHGRGRDPRGRGRRAVDRARQPDRAASGRADGRAGCFLVPTLMTYEKIARVRRGVRHARRTSCARSSTSSTPAWTASSSRATPACRSGSAPTCSASCNATRPRSSGSAAAPRSPSTRSGQRPSSTPSWSDSSGEAASSSRARYADVLDRRRRSPVGRVRAG